MVGDIVRFQAYAHFACVDPAKNRRRFYTLVWQPTFWGEVALVRSWGRLGTEGRSLAALYPDRDSAQPYVEWAIRRRLRRGYQVVDFK